MSSLPLTDDDRALLSVRADEFHAALARGGVGDWGQYLAGLSAALRRAVLTELVLIDLAHRWGHGERPVVEEYVARFPDLGPEDKVPAAVIVEECRCRAKAGDQPSPETYRSRFPAQYAEIQSELESVRGATAVGTIASTIVSDDGGAALAKSHQPGSGADEYEFLRVLGRGVFGEVWLARKVTSGIEKAIKILLHPSDKEATGRERRALELIKNLRHPYLLSTDDFWVSGDRLHIVMELADFTLRNRLQRCREDGLPGIPAVELLGYLGEAAEGLDFLHSRHVTHRDIKPDNILLLHRHAKVGDFGLARYQEEVLAPMKTFAGTPAYMAPEVWGRKGGPASDQYSLAVTYAELRQGFAPIKARPIPEMFQAHADGEYDFSDAIVEAERAVIRKALSMEPADRYATCIAFVEALTEALELTLPRRPSGVVAVNAVARREPPPEPTHPDSETSLGTRADGPKGTVVDEEFVPPPPAPPVPPPRGVRVVAVAISGVVLAGVVGLVIWAFGGNGNPPPGGSESRLEPDPDKSGNTDYVLNDNRKAWRWVRMKVGEQFVCFRLVFGGNGPDAVEPFYVMESKVWNSLYREARMTPPADSDANGPDAPVTNVTADEAAQFAKVALGGTLPTPKQWDHAAGVGVAHRPTVARVGGRPRVNIARPGPTHGPLSRDDVSEYELLDMAGNGREWTRGVLSSAKVVGVDALSPTDLVILRGRNFTLQTGLTFKDLEDEQKTPQTQFPTVRSPYTSFRVVVPVP
jgi:serine/threonine protein kinase